MLLHSLKAVNFGRFQEISIADLPRRGVVALSAENEADRQIYRDMIVYALFGHTLDGDSSPGKLIRKGAGYAFVEVSFTHSEVGRVSILRGLDRRGTQQVSLRELEKKSVLRQEAEVAERLEALIDLDPGEFGRIFLAAGPVPDDGPLVKEEETEDLAELMREKKRVSSRLRRARKRLETLAGGEAGKAADEIEELQAVIAASEPEEGAEEDAEDPGDPEEQAFALFSALRQEASLGALTEKVRGLEDVARRLKSDRRRLSQTLLKLETEKRDTLERLRRVNEYRERLDHLKSSMLASDLGLSAGSGDADSLGALGRELRRYGRGRVARQSLFLALGLVGVAVVLLAMVFVARRSMDAPSWVYYLLGFTILLDLVFAFRSFRDYEEALASAPDPACAEEAFDPLPLLTSIEDEYQDVIPAYRPGLPQKLKDKLGELDSRLAEPGKLQERLDGLLDTLEREWKRAKRECPHLPEGPEEEGGGTREPLKEEELAGLPDRLNRMVDEILKLSVRAADASASAPPDVEEAEAAFSKALGGLLESAGRKTGAEAVLEKAGLRKVRDLAGEADTRKQERLLAGFEDSVRAELAKLTTATAKRKSKVAGTLDRDEAARRLGKLKQSLEKIEGVREKARLEEARLEELSGRIERSRTAAETDEGAPNGAELPADVARYLSDGRFKSFQVGRGGALTGIDEAGDRDTIEDGSPLGRKVTLALALLRTRNELGERHEGARFVLLSGEQLPSEGCGAAELLGLAEKVAPNLSQVLVTVEAGRAPSGSILRKLHD